MDGKIKTIGILTSGGDAPGMNAAIRAVTRTALLHGIKVKGIYRGYHGLMYGNVEADKKKGIKDEINIREMGLRDVSGILGRGGTVLYSARCKEFATPEGVARAVEMCIKEGIDGLVTCGGDGTFRGARDLSLKGVPCIGIPCTIDNDIASTSYSIGFDTAVNTVIENIDKLRDTCLSHDRCSVVEVMGNRCGDIALQAAICCGAVSVLIPELEVELERDVVKKMRTTLMAGKNHFIVIVAEGVGKKDPSLSADAIAKYIKNRTKVETRATVIGHVQRGGSPTAKDRVKAAQMGHHAVHLLEKGIGNRVVAVQKSKIVDIDILEALEMSRTVDMNLVRVANEISI